MDALSEVLRLARFSAGVTLDATARAPWCVFVPSSASIARAHLVVDGNCVVKVGSADPIGLKAGEMAFLAHGDAHLVGSTLEAEAKPLSAFVKTSLAGELVPVSIGRDGPATRWIVLTSSCERHLADPLIAALPPVIKVDLNNAAALHWLIDALGLTLSASSAPPVGASAERARLAELVLIEALSRHIYWLPPGGKGWLAGLNDRFVGRALALVHGRPSEPWTVERLGRHVGLSRSALADRFVEVMGEPIFAFLTRWRLQVAAEFLLSTTRPIATIAHDAGYESAGAFSVAFKRVFGKPPSIWRRKSRRK
ncbi:MAG: AraC family transcriptional regulator [Burkholderiales bacterium]|nr:AraC family transcriptional regulator [Burkholderiales bacterium]